MHLDSTHCARGSQESWIMRASVLVAVHLLHCCRPTRLRGLLSADNVEPCAGSPTDDAGTRAPPLMARTFDSGLVWKMVMQLSACGSPAVSACRRRTIAFFGRQDWRRHRWTDHASNKAAHETRAAAVWICPHEMSTHRSTASSGSNPPCDSTTRARHDGRLQCAGTTAAVLHLRAILSCALYRIAEHDCSTMFETSSNTV
jgi:hypothetical protein